MNGTEIIEQRFYFTLLAYFDFYMTDKCDLVMISK